MLAAALRSRSALGLCRARASLHATARLSDSITYSGGQASVGQGGFYGSGGARCTKTSVEWNQNCIASAEKVANLVEIMNQAYKLQEVIGAGDPLSEAVIESKASLKKLMTSPTTVEYIDSLEVNDEPVWGLSQKERSLVKEARYMSQTC